MQRFDPNAVFCTPDPAVLVAEERDFLTALIEGMPDGEKANAICDRLADCEAKILSQPVRSREGFLAQLDVVRWKVDQGIAPSGLFTAIGVLLEGLRAWDRAEAAAAWLDSH